MEGRDKIFLLFLGYLLHYSFTVLGFNFKKFVLLIIASVVVTTFTGLNLLGVYQYTVVGGTAWNSTSELRHNVVLTTLIMAWWWVHLHFTRRLIRWMIDIYTVFEFGAAWNSTYQYHGRVPDGGRRTVFTRRTAKDGTFQSPDGLATDTSCRPKSIL